MPDPESDEILDPKLKPAERKRLLETAHLLEQARPMPRPGVQGQARQTAACPLRRPPARAIADRRLCRLGTGPARGGGGRAGRVPGPWPPG